MINISIDNCIIISVIQPAISNCKVTVIVNPQRSFFVLYKSATLICVFKPTNYGLVISLKKLNLIYTTKHTYKKMKKKQTKQRQRNKCYKNINEC